VLDNGILALSAAPVTVRYTQHSKPRLSDLEWLWTSDARVSPSISSHQRPCVGGAEAIFVFGQIVRGERKSMSGLKASGFAFGFLQSPAAFFAISGAFPSRLGKGENPSRPPRRREPSCTEHSQCLANVGTTSNGTNAT